MNSEQLEKTVYRIEPEIVILDSDEMIVLLGKAKGNRERYGDISEGHFLAKSWKWGDSLWDVY